MSQFEYVSVAVALVYALVVGRLLAGLTPSLQSQRRYAIQVVWIFVLLLVCILQWWVLWRTNTVDWTALRFLWVLSGPGLLYVRSAILIGDPRSIESYKDHFSGTRVAFFSVGVVISLHAGLGPWIFGLVAWFELAPIHPFSFLLGSFSAVGLVSTNETLHLVIALGALSMVMSAFFILPPLPAPA